jgi:hypothetical protein
MPKAKSKRKERAGEQANGLPLLLRAIRSEAQGHDGNQGFLSLLQEHRLYALAAAHPEFVEESAAFNASDLGEQLVQIRRRLAIRDALLESGLGTAINALEKAGVQPLILKGRALGMTLYEKPWHRPHSDIDLLISPADRKAVHNLLPTLGFELPFGIRGDLTSHQFLYRKELQAGVTLHLDIHWRLSNRQHFARAIRYRDARLRSITIERQGVQHRLLHPEDLLLHALIHLHAHHDDEDRPYLWFYDIHLLLKTLTDSELDRVLDRAIACEASTVARIGIESTIKLCGTKLPANIQTKLQDMPDDSSADYIEMSRIAEIKADFSALAGTAEKFTYLRELIFPPPRSMLERYDYQSRALLPFAYIRRLLEVARGESGSEEH